MLSRRDFLTSSVVLSAAASVQRRAPLRVAVVGAGAFGGWTALSLRRAGAEVTLVDAWGPGNARASSGGETRVIRTIYGPTRRYVEMAARALQLWSEWDRVSAESFYRRTGVLWMTTTDDSYVRQSLPALRDLKLAYEELDAAGAAKRWPQINFDAIGRVYLEHEGGYLLARHACDAVARELVRIGGTYRQVAVVSVTSDGRRPDVSLSDGTKLRADRYVFACGPWLGRVFPDVIGARVKATGRRSTISEPQPATIASATRACRCGSKPASVSSTAFPATCTAASRSPMMREEPSSIRPMAIAIRQQMASVPCAAS